MGEQVPTYTELAPVYGVDGEFGRPHADAAVPRSVAVRDAVDAGNPKAQERYAWLSDGFKERFGSTPTLFARAPGEFAKISVIRPDVDVNLDDL